MTPDEIPTAVCRLFGFGRVTEDMKSTIDTLVQDLLRTQQFASVGDMNPAANGLSPFALHFRRALAARHIGR